jgi:hypothetical protein
MTAHESTDESSHTDPPAYVLAVLFFLFGFLVFLDNTDQPLWKDAAIGFGSLAFYAALFGLATTVSVRVNWAAVSAAVERVTAPVAAMVAPLLSSPWFWMFVFLAAVLTISAVAIHDKRTGVWD